MPKEEKANTSASNSLYILALLAYGVMIGVAIANKQRDAKEMAQLNREATARQIADLRSTLIACVGEDKYREVVEQKMKLNQTFFF